MSDADDHELRRLPILRGLRARYEVWRGKRSARRPPGTLGRGAKDSDREQSSREEIEDEQ